MQNPFGDLIPGGQPAAPSGGTLVRITPEKVPDSYQRGRDAAADARAQEDQEIQRRNAAREDAKFEREQKKLAATGGVEATEAERTAAFLATRVADSVAQLTKSPESRPSFATETVRKLPIFGQMAANTMTAADRQVVETNQLDLLDAALTLGTGAAYTKEQLEGYRQTYFPQIGDQPETIAEKQRKLNVILQAARVKAGSAAPLIDKAIQSIGGEGPEALPTAAGAKADPGLGDVGVTPTGGLRYEKGLSALPDEVANRIAGGSSASEIVAFLNEQYQPYGAAVGPDLAATIGSMVSRHKANPRAPVKSLGTGWESFSMLPAEQETSVMGAIADNPVGNFAMHAANAATAGFPTMLAGDQGEAVMAATRAARPVSSFSGDVLGSAAAMSGVNRLAGAAGPAGQLLTRGGGIGGDVAYGATRGANEAGPQGAVLGALGAGAGNMIGRTVLGPALRLGATGAAKAAGVAVPSVTRAENRITRYLPDDAASTLEDAAQANTPMMLADVSPQMRSLAGSVSRRSPEAFEIAETALRPRSQGQGERALAAIESNLGGIENPIEVSEALMRGAAEKAQPLYAEFYAQPARSSPLLKSLLSRPAARDAITRAKEIALDEGENPETWGIDLDPEGQLTVVNDLSPMTLDYIKRAMGDVIESKGKRNDITGKLELGEAGRAVAKLNKAFVAEVDKLYPQYAPARAAYAGPAAAKSALEDGRRMANSRPREIQRRMRDLKGDELEQFRLGLRVGIADKIAGKRLANEAFEPIFGSPNDKGRMTALSEGGAEGFGRVYDMEGKMSATANEVLGNSATARRLASDQAFENRAADIVEGGFALASGAGAQGLGQKLARGAADRARAGFTEKLANELAPLLFNDDPASGARFIRELMARSEKAQAFRRGTALVGGRFGAGLGAGTAAQP